MNTDLLHRGRIKRFGSPGCRFGSMDAPDVSAPQPRGWRLNMRPFQFEIKAPGDEMGSDGVPSIREELQLTV